MIATILVILIAFAGCVALFLFFSRRTIEDVATLEADVEAARAKLKEKAAAKQSTLQTKTQNKTQVDPLVWLDSSKGYKLKGSSGTDVVEWSDVRGTVIVEVETDRMPMPMVKDKGIGFTSAMLLSRQRFAKSANCTLLVACELPAPGEWGTIFGHFNRGTDADGVPWHSKDVQLRVTNTKRVSWHTAGDNERATIAFDEIWPTSSSAPTRGPVVFACTMVSDETSSTMRIDFETATTRGSRSTRLKRSITDGEAPIVVGSSFANEYSNVVVYECLYYTSALSPTDLETQKSELVRRWL